MFDSVLRGSQANEVRALFDDPVLARLGLLNPQAARRLIESYQIAPKIGETLMVSELLGIEIFCREVLGEPISTTISGGQKSEGNAAQSFGSGF